MADGGIKQWQYNWDGEQYRESGLTINQAGQIEDHLGLSWLEINPLRSAKQARVILAVMHTDRTGKPFDEVFAALGDVTTQRFIVDVIEWVDADMPDTYVDGGIATDPPSATA